MPVAPAFAMIGTAMGASAATATAVGVSTTIGVAGLGAQAYGMVQANRASQNAAKLATATSDYNARVDEADAKQIELDSSENTRRAREEARIYTSRQLAAFAASGVLVSGSPLAVMATTAGRIEQQIQQEAQDRKRQANRLRDSARMTRLYGESSAAGIRERARADLIGGASRLLQAGANLYQGGIIPSVPAGA